MVAVFCNVLTTLKNHISAIAIIGKASTTYQQWPHLHFKIPEFYLKMCGLLHGFILCLMFYTLYSNIVVLVDGISIIMRYNLEQTACVS